MRWLSDYKAPEEVEQAHQQITLLTNISNAASWSALLNSKRQIRNWKHSATLSHTIGALRSGT